MSKMWLDKERLSIWAIFYHESFESVHQKYDFKNLITDSYCAYKYCLNIKDNPEVRKYITEPSDCHLYCSNVRYDKKLAKIARQDGYNI